MPDLPADAITAEVVETFTVALALAAAVPGATAGDCYRAGLEAAAPALRAQGAATEREAVVAWCKSQAESCREAARHPSYAEDVETVAILAGQVLGLVRLIKHLDGDDG